MITAQAAESKCRFNKYDCRQSKKDTLMDVLFCLAEGGSHKVTCNQHERAFSIFQILNMPTKVPTNVFDLCKHQ